MRVRWAAQDAISFGRQDKVGPATLEEAREWGAEWLRSQSDVKTVEGDAPGQYRLELEGEYIYLIHIDEFGRETRELAGN